MFMEVPIVSPIRYALWNHLGATMQLRLMQLLRMAILGVPAVEAQTPAFEVASVKPSRLVDSGWSLGCGNPAGRGGVPPGRCRAANASLLRIFSLAYNLPIFSA